MSNSGKVIGWTSSILSRSKIVMTVTMMATVAIHCGDPGVFHGMGLPGELAAVPAGLHQAAASDSTPLTLPPSLPTTAAHGSTSCLLTVRPWWRIKPGFLGDINQTQRNQSSKDKFRVVSRSGKASAVAGTRPSWQPPPGLLSTSDRHHIQPYLGNDHSS